MEIVTQKETGAKSVLKKLEQFISQRERKRQIGEDVSGFSDFENELHQQLVKVEQELVAAELKQYDVSAAEIEIEGERYCRVMLSGKNYLSSAGEVRVERYLYRRTGAVRERCVCPLELGAGIMGGYATPRASRQMNFVAAHLPSRNAADFFTEMGGMAPSHTTIDNQPKVVAEVWEANWEKWEQSLRRTEKISPQAAVIAVSLDGVMAPVRQADGTKKEAVKGKQASGPLGYREIGCGTVALYDQEGERLQTVRYGRMPERKKATLRQQLTAECQHIFQQAPHLKVVKLADGARDNWDYLSALNLGGFSNQTDVEQIEIVDFCHAAEHLKRGCDAIFSKDPAKSQAKFETLRFHLKEVDGGAEKIIRSFRYYLGRLSGKNKDDLKAELTYFCNQQLRMDYPAYIRQNLPIASGVIEATCKTLVTQRMKCSGMRWNIAGGQAILTLRSLVQSNRWNAAWWLIQTAFCKPVSIVKEQNESNLRQNVVASKVLAPISDCIQSEYASLPLAT